MFGPEILKKKKRAKFTGFSRLSTEIQGILTLHCGDLAVIVLKQGRAYSYTIRTVEGYRIKFLSPPSSPPFPFPMGPPLLRYLLRTSGFRQCRKRKRCLLPRMIILGCQKGFVLYRGRCTWGGVGLHKETR